MTPALRFLSVLATGLVLAISNSFLLAAQTPATTQLPAPTSATEPQAD